MNETKGFRNEDRHRRIMFLETNRNGNKLNANIVKRKKIKNTKPILRRKDRF